MSNSCTLSHHRLHQTYYVLLYNHIIVIVISYDIVLMYSWVIHDIVLIFMKTSHEMIENTFKKNKLKHYTWDVLVEAVSFCGAGAKRFLLLSLNFFLPLS